MRGQQTYLYCTALSELGTRNEAFRSGRMASSERSVLPSQNLVWTAVASMGRRTPQKVLMTSQECPNSSGQCGALTREKT